MRFYGYAVRTRNTYPHQQVHIGDADGLVCLWLNEQSAYDLAACFSHDDVGRSEIIDAVQRAYPEASNQDRDPAKRPT